MHDDTIFALASAQGRAGIAVIRLSGEGCTRALGALGCPVPPPRRATRACFIDPATHEVLDDGLVLWFPAPHSFTGEDVAELHVHGGRAVVDSLFAALTTVDGLRMAEPGEFSRRAFAHDKLDLTQAEAIADLVDAESRAQQRQALRQMGGALKELYDDWRHRLVQVLAHLEALIDFPDEDLPPDVNAKVWHEVGMLAQAIQRHLDDGGRGERVREGLEIAIVGAPNAGKSSLLNALARRDAAIVSHIPGTTRDAIAVALEIGGYAVTLIDTAGLRETVDEIESEGVRRARVYVARADIKIALFDGAAFPARDDATAALIDKDTITVVSKADLFAAIPEAEGDSVHFISVVSGGGIDGFLKSLGDMIRQRFDAGDAAPLTRTRHRAALVECRAALRRAQDTSAPELAAEDLRLAARALGRLTGRVEVDEILDVVFRDFCIGK